MKVLNMKKGQAALEFLSTYGFAFLIILVMIGALAYFGVLNPTNLLPQKNSWSPEIGGVDFQIDGDGAGNTTLSLVLKNNFGDSVKINNMTITDTLGNTIDGVDGTSCTVDFGSGAGGRLTSGDSWPAGATSEFVCSYTSSNAPVVGSKQSYTIVIDALPSQKRFPRTVSGEIFGEVV